MTGKPASLKGNTTWQFGVYGLRSQRQATAPLIYLGCMCKHSMLVWVIQLGICWPCMCWIGSVCEYMQCVSQDVVFTCHLPATWEVPVKCGRQEHRAGLLFVHVWERCREVIILDKAVIFTGLGLVGNNMWPIPTMEMCAFPSEVNCGNTNGFHNILL